MRSRGNKSNKSTKLFNMRGGIDGEHWPKIFKLFILCVILSIIIGGFVSDTKKSIKNYNESNNNKKTIEDLENLKDDLHVVLQWIWIIFAIILCAYGFIIRHMTSGT